MILRSMTATFGKLEGETLTLTPGLNLLEEPNEWGKSTWCAFLLAMLYGVDTGQRARQGVIPDKDRYKPWSGKPMEGRMDLTWQGRDITIQRTTKGRIPMGEFRAYETASGQIVPELTKENCGLLLLGVERPVYQRSGFLRLSDLPVTQDEALEKRLNALVTTGSESTAGLDLEKKLRDLQNRCRHNKTGLLPQAEARLAALQDDLTQAEERTTEQARLESRLASLQLEEQDLLRHKTALARQEALEKRKALELAEIRQREAQALSDRWEETVKSLPNAETARSRIRDLQALSSELETLHLDSAAAPAPPEAPAAPAALSHLEGQSPEDRARQDRDRISRLDAQKPGSRTPFLLLFALFLSLGIGFSFVKLWIGLLFALFSLGVLTFGLLFVSKKNRIFSDAQREKAEILSSYGAQSPEDLLPIAGAYAAAFSKFQQDSSRYAIEIERLDSRRQDLAGRTQALTEGRGTPAQALAYWQSVLNSWEQHAESLRDLFRAQEHAQALLRLLGNSVPEEDPTPDDLDLTAQETQEALSRNRDEQARLRSALDQSRGRQAALGDPGAMSAEAEALKSRIFALEDIYAALGYAQSALKSAGDDLRRQFSPRITAQARDILSELTDGRYDKLLWEENFSLSAGTLEDIALQSALRRSDGTIDQIYLSLRLAVCRELLGPDTPIVLDDALVRFDDRRLSKALALLQKEGEHRQILLFTCQSREKRLLSQ